MINKTIDQVSRQQYPTFFSFFISRLINSLGEMFIFAGALSLPIVYSGYGYRRFYSSERLISRLIYALIFFVVIYIGCVIFLFFKSKRVWSQKITFEDDGLLVEGKKSKKWFYKELYKVHLNKESRVVIQYKSVGIATSGVWIFCYGTFWMFGYGKEYFDFINESIKKFDYIESLYNDFPDLGLKRVVDTIIYRNEDQKVTINKDKIEISFGPKNFLYDKSDFGNTNLFINSSRDILQAIKDGSYKVFNYYKDDGTYYASKVKISKNGSYVDYPEGFANIYTADLKEVAVGE